MYILSKNKKKSFLLALNKLSYLKKVNKLLFILFKI